MSKIVEAVFGKPTQEDVPPPIGSAAKGPRNLPQPDARKKKRQEAKQKRKANRGVYSGQ